MPHRADGRARRPPGRARARPTRAARGRAEESSPRRARPKQRSGGRRRSPQGSPGRRQHRPAIDRARNGCQRDPSRAPRAVSYPGHSAPREAPQGSRRPAAPRPAPRLGSGARAARPPDLPRTARLGGRLRRGARHADGASHRAWLLAGDGRSRLGAAGRRPARAGGPPVQTYAWAVTFLLASLVTFPLWLRAVLLLPEQAVPAGRPLPWWPWVFSVFGLLAFSWVFGTPLPPPLGQQGSLGVNVVFIATLLAVITRGFRRA